MIDLHTHSTASDGTLTPSRLAEQANEAGLTALALTDHDTVAGIDEFMAGCRQAGIEGIPGVEFSASWYGGSLHLVGLFIDHFNGPLRELLEEIRRHRARRNETMVAKLNEAGAAITLEELKQEAGGEVVGRPHVAEILVRKRFCPDRKTAFDRWIGTGCPAYVRRFLPLPEDVIGRIHGAGGIAVMAHPFGNPHGETRAKVRKTLKYLAELGLDGVEVYYSDHSPEETADAMMLAREFSLAPSGGSDFHGRTMPGMELGRGRGNLRIADDLLAGLKARAAVWKNRA